MSFTRDELLNQYVSDKTNVLISEFQKLDDYKENYNYLLDMPLVRKLIEKNSALVKKVERLQTKNKELKKRNKYLKNDLLDVYSKVSKNTESVNTTTAATATSTSTSSPKKIKTEKIHVQPTDDDVVFEKFVEHNLSEKNIKTENIVFEIIEDDVDVQSEPELEYEIQDDIEIHEEEVVEEEIEEEVEVGK